MQPFTQLPPQAEELEAAVLGAIMIDRDALPGIVDILKPGSFYRSAHQAIYSACLDLLAAGDAIDILTVSERLRKNGKMETVGGSSYLAELTNRVASAANIEYHARIVAQKALARDLISLSTNTIKAAYSDETDPFALLYDTQKASFELANFGGRQAKSLSAIGLDVLRQLDRAMRKGDGMTGVPSGIQALDNITGGWQAPDLVILAGRPGMGKTALALTWAYNAAAAGFPVGFFSLEMSSVQLTQRIVSSRSGISSNRIMRGDLTEDEARRVQEAVQALSAMPFHIDDSAGISIFEMQAKARRLKMQHGIKILFVDYLQLMSGMRDRNSNREQEISAISRGLKMIAKDLEIPVIALSQLSRAVEMRADKRPQLSDLRESGAIEQDADIVSFVYRPDYYDLKDEVGQSTDGFSELIIEKHRNGALDAVGMYFHAPTTTFMDLSKKSQFPHQTAQPVYSPALPAGAGRVEDVPF